MMIRALNVASEEKKTAVHRLTMTLMADSDEDTCPWTFFSFSNNFIPVASCGLTKEQQAPQAHSSRHLIR